MIFRDTKIIKKVVEEKVNRTDFVCDRCGAREIFDRFVCIDPPPNGWSILQVNREVSPLEGYLLCPSCTKNVLIVAISEPWGKKVCA